MAAAAATPLSRGSGGGRGEGVRSRPRPAPPSRTGRSDNRRRGRRGGAPTAPGVPRGGGRSARCRGGRGGRASAGRELHGARPPAAAVCQGGTRRLRGAFLLSEALGRRPARRGRTCCRALPAPRRCNRKDRLSPRTEETGVIEYTSWIRHLGKKTQATFVLFPPSLFYHCI